MSNLILKKASTIIIFLVIAVFLTSCSSGKNIVAKVNNQDITSKEFTDTFNMVKNRIKSNPQYNKDVWNKDYNGKKLIDAVKENVMDNLIMEKILLKQAQKQNITASSKEIDDEYNKEKLANKDITKEEAKNNLLINKLIDGWTKDVKISDEEIKKYYESNKSQFEVVKASHILVADEKTANEIYNKLMQGADFAQMAKQYSIDTSTKDKGGELGEFPRGTMVQEFDNAVFNLKAGEISKPVKTQFGYHIIKSEGITVKSLDDVKDYIKQNLEDSKKREIFDTKYNELKKDAKIEEFPQNIKVTVD
ncbi:peptidylprolyl isomerase [Aceticella autotrophica]|uniref:peptidylprolyl isomerase n=1 Tax=Aceticella autotrophica TaxID=2755338 RepID=A0A975GAK2_9THEO|nr:peptidylprolyl isomerase [Aceticella autotrophica]